MWPSAEAGCGRWQRDGGRPACSAEALRSPWALSVGRWLRRRLRVGCRGASLRGANGLLRRPLRDVSPRLRCAPPPGLGCRLWPSAEAGCGRWQRMSDNSGDWQMAAARRRLRRCAGGVRLRSAAVLVRRSRLGNAGRDARVSTGRRPEAGWISACGNGPRTGASSSRRRSSEPRGPLDKAGDKQEVIYLSWRGDAEAPRLDLQRSLGQRTILLGARGRRSTLPSRTRRSDSSPPSASLRPTHQRDCFAQRCRRYPRVLKLAPRYDVGFSAFIADGIGLDLAADLCSALVEPFGLRVRRDHARAILARWRSSLVVAAFAIDAR